MTTEVAIKVCGITRIEDARLALDAGADYIGVITYPKSPRFVPHEQLPYLLEAIPPGKRVMVTVSPGTDELEEFLPYQFDYYQLHFDLEVSLATLAGWSGIVGQHALWGAPRIPPDEVQFPQVIMEFADTLLLDAYSKAAYGGTGLAGSNWQRFRDCAILYQHKRWILAGGLNPGNIREAIEATGATAVDVNSGIEQSAGIKDARLLRAFFEAVRG